MTLPNIIRPVTEWRDPRHRRGLAGELAAARYLAARGWAVAAHRFRVGRHDVDLIIRRSDLVAFVEVKTRATTSFGDGREAVGWKKRSVIEMVAAVWAARFGRPWMRYRFDLVVVGIAKTGTGVFPRVSHIPDAWRRVEKW